MTLAEVHLAIQIDDRETGFEATQASVPDSRSRARRPDTARIAARTKTCAPSANPKLSSGARLNAAGGMTSSGRRSAMTLLIQALAAVRTMNRLTTATMTGAR